VKKRRGGERERGEEIKRKRERDGGKVQGIKQLAENNFIFK
jgi:hypothetical protein